MRILIVEDDPIQVRVLMTMLQDYHVETIGDGQSAWHMHQELPYDLMIVDVDLPKLSGISFCQQLRQRGDNTPLLLITADNSTDMRIKGLTAGADDYINKPILLSELKLRVRNILRRRTFERHNIIHNADIQLDSISHIASYKSQPISLTPKEFDILELFLTHPDRVYSRAQMVELLWPYDADVLEESVKAHIKGLRQKLRKAGAPEVIKNVRGSGYKFKPLPISDAEPHEYASLSKGEIKILWEAFSPLIKERLYNLQQAVQAITHSSLSLNQRQTAKESAHKLVGSLGMFDTTVTLAGRRLENLFSSSLKINFNNTMLNDVDEIAKAVDKLDVNSAMAVKVITYPERVSSVTVLAVDDDLMFLKVISSVLEKAGIRVETLNQTDHILDTLAHLQPDLLLLDIDMPQENGIAVCKKLRDDSRWKNLPIIFVTAHQEPETISKIFEVMADDYICKPIVKEEFTVRVVNRLRRLQKIHQ